ncbi:MAG: hypothetical protein F6K14_31045 [Symploca sp. SIO2C1]|nr:hypothetical protein [Symploca sp. SIO2C1]
MISTLIYGERTILNFGIISVRYAVALHTLHSILMIWLSAIAALVGMHQSNRAGRRSSR